MADIAALAEIRIWGGTVGAVAETDRGSIVFEYAEDFRKGGLDISPLHLPRTLRGPTEFADLRAKAAFQGLPGVLADVLPDSFGSQVIRAYYTARGEMQKSLSPVQHLLYVGTRGIGALEFHPAESLPTRTPESEALEVAQLVADARRIIAGEVDVTVPEIYRIGSSAGGMRPKAVVLWNEATREIRSGFAPPASDDIAAILKFDGVGKETPPGELGPPQAFNRIEAAYAAMARGAGVDAVQISMLETAGGYAHLVIPRFDRNGDRRLHQHTLGGLLHVDYNDPGASSYEEYLRTILRLGMAQGAVIEGYRRMLFNVIAVNQDDHVKNLSFHMDETGAWSLTPAYDLTFAHGSGWTTAHQMRVADKLTGITRADVVAVGDTFGIRAPGSIVDEVLDAVAEWPGYARDRGVPADAEAVVSRALAERRKAIR